MEQDRDRPGLGSPVDRRQKDSRRAESVVEIETVRPGVETVHPSPRQEPGALDRHRAEAQRLAERLAPARGPRLALGRVRRQRLPLDAPREPLGDSENGQVVVRQADLEFGCGLQLRPRGQVALDVGQSEVAREEPVGLEPVVGLVVVVSWIEVLVKPEVGPSPEQVPHRGERVVGPRLDPVGPEDVLRVVDLQQGPWRDQGRQVRVLGLRQQVAALLLPVADVPCPEVLDPGDQRRVARHRDGHPDALVQRTQEHGLPAPSGEAGHPDPRPVHGGVRVEEVQTLPRRKVEQADPVGAYEVQMGAEPVLVLGMREFAEVEPVEIESVDALPGLVDAALLLVLDLLAHPVDVAVDVEDRRSRAGRSLGLIQQRRNPEAGNDLDAKLADPVAGASRQEPAVLEGKRRVNPLRGPARQDGGLQLRADRLRVADPLVGGRRTGRGRNPLDEIPAQLVLDDLPGDQRLSQNGLQSRCAGLARCGRRSQRQGGGRHGGTRPGCPMRAEGSEGRPRIPTLRHGHPPI